MIFVDTRFRYHQPPNLNTSLKNLLPKKRTTMLKATETERTHDPFHLTLPRLLILDLQI